MEDDSIAESLQYDFSAISAATDNFSDANKLGEGGFGPVYKVIYHYFGCNDSLNCQCIQMRTVLHNNLVGGTILLTYNS